MNKVYILFTLCLLSFMPLLKAQKVGDTIRVGNDVYMLVSEINGVDNNAVFQKNVAIMHSYAEALGKQKQLLEENDTLSEEEKKALNIKIKEVEDIYMSNNELMKKNYNFIVERQYRQDYDDVYISTKLTEGEFDMLKFVDGTDLDIDKIAISSTNKIYRQKRLQGLANVRKFQGEIYAFFNGQVELDALQKELLLIDYILEKNAIYKKISSLDESQENAKVALEKLKSELAELEYLIEKRGASISTFGEALENKQFVIEKSQRDFFKTMDSVEKNRLSAKISTQKDLLEPEYLALKNNINLKISSLNTSLKESENLLHKEYSMSPNRDYFIEVNSCKLYLLMTPQELANHIK